MRREEEDSRIGWFVVLVCNGGLNGWMNDWSGGLEGGDLARNYDGGDGDGDHDGGDQLSETRLWGKRKRFGREHDGTYQLRLLSMSGKLRRRGEEPRKELRRRPRRPQRSR